MNWDDDNYTMKYRWEPAMHPEGDGLLITEILNGAVQEVMHAKDEALKTLFVQYLRTQGYGVVEPGDVPQLTRFMGYSALTSAPNQPPQWGHYLASYMDECQERFEGWLRGTE